MKKISFERFNELVSEADYIEIGDDVVIDVFQDLNRIVMETEVEEGLVRESEFFSSNFVAETDKSGSVFATDQEGNECEIRFYKGILIQP